MNNKGFTLIELVATVTLLGILAVVSFVSITGIINKSKVNDCENLVISIKMAVKEYASDNRYEGITTSISASDLITGKYLSSPIINPFTDEEMDASNIKINISLNNDYTVKEITFGAPAMFNDCKNGI